jgi:hypothetical protein
MIRLCRPKHHLIALLCEDTRDFTKILTAKRHTPPLMNTRTSISFRPDFDIWPVVDRWAALNNFKVTQAVGFERVYQKGRGFLVAPMMVAIRQTGAGVGLDAWVRFSFFVRLMSFFILPPEMGIQSGGWKGVVPRSLARTAVNELLMQLRQLPIP